MGAAELILREYLRTPDAAGAESWQLDALSILEWPDDVVPSVETYRQLRAALGTAVRSKPAMIAGG